MGATTAARSVRERNGDFDCYLKGRGIDIGAGADPLFVPAGTVRAWDQKEGNAQSMAGVPDDEYDFVYSSHCIEHLANPLEALRNWIRILKPGGILYVVVPDWQLYEKRMWPSRFNPSHLHTFSLDQSRSVVGRDNHYHVAEDLLPFLEERSIEVLATRLEDDGYDHRLPPDVDQTLDDALAQICIIGRKREPSALARIAGVWSQRRTWMRRLVRVAACMFFVYHSLAVTTWHLPGPLGDLRWHFEEYMVRSGSWQFWNMFDTAPSLARFSVELRATDRAGQERSFGTLLPDFGEYDGYLRHDVFFFRSLYSSPPSPFIIDYVRRAGEQLREREGFEAVSIMLHAHEQRLRRPAEVRADGIASVHNSFVVGPFPIQ